MNQITGRCCATCKHFQPSLQQGQYPECHRWPPHVQSHMVGKAPNGQPMLHRDVHRDITMPDWKCGEWQLRLVQAASISDLPQTATAQ